MSKAQTFTLYFLIEFVCPLSSLNREEKTHFMTPQQTPLSLQPPLLPLLLCLLGGMISYDGTIKRCRVKTWSQVKLLARILALSRQLLQLVRKSNVLKNIWALFAQSLTRYCISFTLSSINQHLISWASFIGLKPKSCPPLFLTFACIQEQRATARLYWVVKANHYLTINLHSCK